MTGFRTSYRSNAPLGIAGKLFASLFFLLFLGMGLLFVGFIVRDTVVGLKVWTWRKTNCEIVASSVRETDEQERRTGNFYFDVTYRYTFGGQTFSSDQYQRNAKPFSDYGKAMRLTERYRPGASAICYVNPAAPAEAVLNRQSLFSLVLVLFPMIFVAIGAGGIYFTWRRKPAGEEGAQPISDHAGLAKGQRLVLVFFSVFLLMGSAFFYGFFLRPMFKILAARQWPAVPCMVITSEVKSHSDSDGTTYSIDILFSYQFNGREYKANRYNFMGGSSSGYSGKQAVVSRHPPGTRTVCYVDPNDPLEAVLERGFTPEMWFGLIPLLFVAVGAGGLVFTLRQRRQTALSAGAAGQAVSSRSLQSGALPFSPTGGAGETLLLKPKVAPWAKLLGAIVAALFWNGIVSVFVMHAAASWRSGHPDWFLTIFMIPFVLIGLVLVGAIGYYFLALFNPRPRLRLTPGAVPLGGTLRLEWEIAGRAEMLQGLRVRLEGREEAIYRRGTNTCKDKSVFADIEIANITVSQEMRSGTRTVTIPAGLMHSFAGKNNKILWVIRLQGDIPRWPDVKEEFPVTVLPPKRISNPGL